ncbi:MAG TPA: four-carbon acid sugar kinase family protein [Chloroflexota bacterium]
MADDLTGAADTGVQFRRVGVPARVWLGRHAPDAFGATVYDTDTRAAGPAAAAAAVERIATLLVPGERVYKKVDSTMRGNVGAEVEALLRALRRRLAVLAPAFPANGRTTVDGVQRVGGVPAHLTAVGRDPAHPMRWPTIAGALRAQSRLFIHLVGLEVVRGEFGPLAKRLADLSQQPSIVVADAETDDDLRAIAEAVAALGHECLPVGSAGLAAHLAAVWGLGSAETGLGTPSLKGSGPGILFVCGSTNPRTLEQVRRLPGSPIDAADPDALEEAVSRLRAGEPAVLSSAVWPAGATAEQIAAALGGLVAGVAARARPDALLLTGGDTARAVLGALDGHGIELDDELLPGMPVGRIAGGGLAGTRVITKAGGFGPPDALVRAIRYLRGETTPDEEARR